MNAPHRTTCALPMTLLLVTATVACYWPVHNHAFINFDDTRYITANFIVQQGLTPDGVSWAFTSLEAANWHPLTWMSHMVDCSLFGLNPAGHHLMSVGLHAINAALLLWLLARMTGSFMRSWLVAALFAIHPLHIESVAWAAERKDVLSCFFGLLTLHAYVRWATSREAGSVHRTVLYVAMLALFAMGLMAKPMLVTWPMVMLLLDFWPLRRMRLGSNTSPLLAVSRKPQRKPRQAATIPQRSVAALVIEKIPLLAMSAASSVITLIAQRRGGAVLSAEELGFGERITNAAVSYVQYLAQSIWPANLAVIYPLAESWPPWIVAGSLATLAAISVLALVMWKRRPWLVVGWLWYLGTLVPVIGLVQVGRQARADRYTYIPLIGVFIMLAWSLPAWRGARLVLMRRAAISATAATLIALGAWTCVQVRYWQDSLTLFSHALDVTDRNSVAHANFAAALLHAYPPRLEESVAHNRLALEYWPRNARAAANLGYGLAMLGDLPQALPHFQLALELRPNDARIMSDLGIAHARAGNYAEAERWFRSALEIEPNLFESMINLGGVLNETKRYAEAIPWLDRALALRPDRVSALQNLGAAYTGLSQFDRAAAAFDAITRLQPGSFDAWKQAGTALLRAGRPGEAASRLEQAAKIRPQAAGELQRQLQSYPDSQNAPADLGTP